MVKGKENFSDGIPMFKKDKRALISPRRSQIKASIVSSVIKCVDSSSVKKFHMLKDERTEEKENFSVGIAMFKKVKRALIPPRRDKIKASIFSSLIKSVHFSSLKKFHLLKDERTEEKDEVSKRPSVSNPGEEEEDGCTISEGEIDAGAELFIGNFRRQLNLLKESTSFAGRDDESEHDLPKDFVSYDEGDDQLQLSEEYTPFGEAVYGREHEKEIVKNILLSADETEENYSFVAIAGKEGMGKTTLARIVFNDIVIMRTFDIRSWASVSNSSKFETIVKQLLESATNEKCPQQSSLNELEYQLQLLVHGKQCLLVLDGDGLDQSPALERILSSLKDCGEGTKIVVTVTNEEVAHTINNCVSHCLLPLLDDRWWMRFMTKEKIFGRFYPKKEFQRIAKKIITKCEGVPLAVKLLVGILERQDIQTLDSVVSNDIQNFIHIELGISNAWRTIYGYLPDHLKSCLEYFTLFPNYFVSEDTLLGLWVAEGFVLQSIDYSAMFSSASEVLAELQYRCLINKDISMHNVIRHLVRPACSKFYCQLDKEPCEVPEKITHASLLGRMIEEKDVEWLLRAKGLCTIFLEFRPNEFLDRLVNWKSLRVICLSEADEMELPSSIGDLEQLRYLRIYKCGITSLPNSICSLSNLQSLEVVKSRDIHCLPEKFGNLMNLCRLNLRKTAINCLPNSFYNLSNLRDLNLSETGICSLPDSFCVLSRLEKLNIRLCHNLSWLPQQFGSLTQLRCLSDYPVRQRDAWGGISELKDLNKLEGTLCISNLGNIGSKKEAESAHLEYKEGLRELIFQWSTQQSTSTLAFEGQTDLDIAQGLRPPGNIRSLSFVNYYADRFPEWMSNKDFFPFLHNLSFSSCLRVKTLGLLCRDIVRVEIRDCLQLISLNVEGGERTTVKIDELIIVDCPNLESIGSLCARRNLHIQGCNKLQISLQTLVTSMVDLESIRQLNIYCDSIFLTFKQLCVIGNPNLSLLPGRLMKFTSLRAVELDDCPLLESIALPPNIIKLRIANCPLIQYLPVTMRMLKSLRSLKIHNLPLLQNLRSDAIPPNLVKLHVTDCLIFEISPHKLQAELLQVLHIHGCPNLRSITDEELPGSLAELAIHECQSLESLSSQGVYNLANLQILQLTNCGKLSLLPGELLSLTFLKELRIDYSPILVSGLPSTLEKLKMWGYENLQCFPQQDLLQNLSSLQRLKIVEFPQLVPLLKELPSSLKQLSICDCPALTILNIDVVRLNSLKKLKIMNCHLLELFGENGLPSMLVELKIMNCEKLKYLPKNLITLTCLESISIFSCPELELQPEHRLPKNLSMLKVIDCPRLILEGKEGACSTWSMKHIPFRYFA